MEKPRWPGPGPGAGVRRLRRVPGSATMRGVELQFKLAALVALRARRRGVRVRLWARAGSARPFDDLVLRLAAPAAPATLYVQLWHAKGQLAEKDFVEEGKKTYLGKYFTFFRKLRTLFAQKSTLPEGNEDSCILAEGSLDDVLCVLYTTKDLPAERPLSQASTTGVLAELENLLRTDTPGAEDCGFFFTAEDTQVWNLFQRKKLEDVYRHEFLPRFRVLCNQSQASHLDCLITEELNKLFSCRLPNVQYHCMDYIQLFKEWLQDENSNYCLDENFPDIEWVLARDVRRQARQVAGEGVITFKDSYCFTLKEALCADHLRIIVPGIPVGLRAAKLLQVLDCEFPSRWLYANPQLLIQFPASVFVALCKRTWVDILVIDTDEVNPGLNEVISAVLSKVKLVEVCSVAHSEGTSRVQQLEEDWEMEHLVCRSEEKLLDRPVHYQGLYVRLGDLVPKWVKNSDPQLSQLIPHTSMLMHTESFSPLQANQTMGEISRTLQFSKEKVFIASATSARLQRVKGGAMMHGVELEIKLAALVALRARRARLPFELFTKAIIAKPFSDLVLRVKAQPSHVGGATVFVDLLHSKGQLDVEDFVEKEKRTHMGKYFDFYERLQNLFSSGTGLPGIEEDDGVLYESSKGEVLFVLYTTKEGSSLKPQLQPLKDGILPVLEDIFKTNGKQGAFSFTPEDKQVWNLFEGENCERVNTYKHEFLPRFRVLCNQLHAENLDGLIAEELNSLFGCHLPNARYHQMDYVQLLREWSQDPDSNYCLSEESGDLEWVLAQDIRRHARLATGDGAVVFREDGCAELRKALEQGHLRVIVPGVPEGIRAAKLLQLLDREFADCWLYTSAELLTQFPAPLLTALCKAPQVEVLVIDANEVSQALGDVINAVLDVVKLVRVCSITHNEAAPKMGQLVEIWRLEHIKRNIEDKEEKDILDRTVLYQGSLVLLRDLVPMWAVPPRPVLKDASHQTSAKSTEFSNPSHVKMISENSFADKDNRFHLPRLLGAATHFGLEYEYKIAGLLALRARRSGLRFQLFLNVAAARPFDDIVLRITAPQPALYLVQIKHMVSRRLMTFRDFFRKGNFSLDRYFKSFEKFRSLHRNREINMREDDRWLMEVPLKNNWFVLLTTAGVSGFKPSQSLSTREQIPHDYLFLTSCGGANDIIRFGPEDEEVWNLFKDNEELKIYQDEFLSQFVLFVNQVTSDVVDSLILHEIKLLLCAQEPTCQSVCFNYINWLKSWSQGDVGFCLTESSHEIEKAVVYHFQKLARAKDLCHVFAFENAYCSHLDAALVQNKSIELVVLGVPPGIRAAKLLQLLDHVVSDGWMYVDDEVWKELSEDILIKVALAVRVVVLDFQHEAEAQKLMQAVGDAVQVVMLYSSPKDGIECHRTGNFLCIEEDWKLEHLTMEAQEKLLDSHVLFQGDSLPLRALEAAWPRVREEADGALLGALARGDAALGAALPGHAEDERLYIPRGLRHPSALCASALRLASAADHLALQGFAPRALRRLQDALGWSDEEARQRWTVLDGNPEAAFERVCAERSALNVHWVECVGGADGEPDAWAVAWRRTRGRAHALAALVRPATGACARQATCVHGAAGAAGDAAAWGARAALLVGPPGAGKSCFLRRSAREARTRDPARWVVYLPLLQHVRLLREMPQAPEITADHLVMLLEAAVKSDHWKSSSIVAEKRFFEAALFETGAISIFIDGFDEICPVYKDKMLRLLQILLTTSVASLLWVSSRPEMLSVLQNVLGCCPVSLTPLTQEQQHSFINSHFQFSSNHTQTIVAKIVEACKSFSDDFSDLLKSPLHLKMALEVLNHEPNWCGHEFDILQLYEVFINQKQQIFMEKYGFKNWENSSIEHSVKSYNNTLFQNCAMYILVADKQFQGVDSAPFEELINKNQQMLVKEKTGIMWMDENGRPHFLHYLFVEYFAASWICENLSTSETARSIMCTLYEHEISSGFHRFLDLMLSENCLLHRAVLMKDSSALTTALHSGVAVDQTDKGGRTALHLAVLHQNKDACLQLVQENCNVNARNLFLNWTPLQFVDAAWKFGKHNYLSELMKITELLLDNGAEHLPLAIIARNEAELVMEAVDKDLPKVLELILEHGITGQNYIIALNKATYGENHRTLRVLKTYYEGTPKPSRKLKKIFRVSQSTFKWAERKPRSSVSFLSNISSTSSKSIIQSLGEEYYNDTESLEHLVAEKSNTLNIATNHPSTSQDSGSVQKNTLFSEFGTNAESIHNLTDLHISAFNGLYERVDRLIKQGISVNQTDKDGFTALHVAAHAGHDAVVEYLLRAGANVNLQSSEGVTALHFAASNGHEKCVKLILQYSADANLSDKSGFTPAHLAVASGHSQVLKILSSRIDWHSKTKLRHTPLHMAAIMGYDSVIDDLLRDTTEPPEADVHGFKPIHLSSISNNAPFAELLIKQGTNPNETTDNGMTPLHLASRHGSVDVVEALLRGGADPNAITSSGAKKLSLATEFGQKDYFESLFESGSDLNVVSKTPLHFAAEGGHSEIIKLLLENGANIHMRNASLDTPSHSAVRSGQKECVQELLHHGADINVQDEEGRTPLHIAAGQGNIEIVKLLLERGADICVKDAILQTPLHNAVRSGQKECVQELLHHGADIHVQDEEGRTPLHIAAGQGNIEIVKLLLERGADIRVKDAILQTPLHNAVRSGQKECVQELLHHGADIHVQDEEGRTPLHIAAGQGNIEIVKLLLERGADIRVKDAILQTPLHNAVRSGQKECVQELLHHGADIHVQDEEGRTPLHIAAGQGNIEIVKLLLERGADICVKDAILQTPLHNAVRSGQKECVQELLHHGADIHVQDEEGRTPLHIAAGQGNIEIVKLLLERGADIRVKDAILQTPLHNAVRSGQKECVQELLHHGADIHVQDEEGRTPLHIAAGQGNIEIVKLLLERGADIRVKDAILQTPLHNAVRSGQKECVQELLHHGADIHVQDEEGRTPLHIAAGQGHIEIVKLLLERGADICVKDASLQTPLHNAVRSGQKECVQELLHHGADIHVQDEEGRTPLHIAAGQGNIEIVKLLLERGADIRVKDAILQTPLHNAVRSGQKECVQELLHHGADIHVQDEEGRTPLHIAAGQGNIEIVKLLLERGADICVKDAILQTPLHNAVRSGQKECVQELLHHGADIHVQDEEGRTPLHISAGQGNIEIVKLLLERGADICVKDASLQTPLHNAVRSGQKECVQELLHHGADVNIQGEDGRTPLHIAAGQGYSEIVKLLLKRGADIHVKDASLETPIHGALRSGQKECVLELLHHGADVNIEGDLKGH